MGKAILYGLVVVLAISAGVVWATPSSGSSSVLLGRGTFNEQVDVRRKNADGWKVDVDGKPNLDVAVQMITFQPGAQSGWHSHPGPVFITVLSGTMTFYESNDPACQPAVRHAGEGFLDTGNHAHIARNETTEPATNLVTYFAPPGAALRIDELFPGNCPF